MPGSPRPSPGWSARSCQSWSSTLFDIHSNRASLWVSLRRMRLSQFTFRCVTTLRFWDHLRSSIVFEGHLYRMPVVIKRERAVADLSSAPFGNSCSQSKHCLQLVHTLHRLVLIDRCPDIRRPVLV